MWPKRNRFFRSLILILTAGIVMIAGIPQGAPAQTAGNSRPQYDPITEKSLQRLQQLLLRGSYDEVRELLKRIIDGSGYIEPLAEICYRLAQNESDGEALVNQYATIIEHWPKSAWAQKALIELTPLILMSGGELGASAEQKIWQHVGELLSPAQDAAQLGENPQDMQADVFIHLLELAHFRSDQIARVLSLIGQVPTRAVTHQDQIDLAAAYATLRSQKRDEARGAFRQWLERYPQSPYRSLAHLALFLASDTESQRDESLRLLLDTFPDSLETMWLSSSQGGRLQ